MTAKYSIPVLLLIVFGEGGEMVIDVSCDHDDDDARENAPTTHVGETSV